MEGEKRSWLRLNCIGKGSFGTVSLAVDKSDGHIFAVKSVQLTSLENFHLEALENEIKTLKSLSSPYVIGYLGDDFSEESSTASYRNLHLEYMPGGTAAEFVKFPGLADVDEKIIRSITSCVVSALKYVHSLGIVHCDVKARNVLVGSSSGAAKLADFGSAMESRACMLPRGSPLWMAPEVIRGEYQGPESDVWSLGCTVIEMITGKPAWEDRGADTLCQIGYSDELPKFPTQLSELCRDFLGKCLRRDRKERWSCDQLLQHPFLLSSCPSDVSAHYSPRCTLDWLNSSFSDENKELCNSESSIFYAKERVMKLATKSGAIWEESDSWVAVRTLPSEKEDSSSAISCQHGGDMEERERTIFETPELTMKIIEKNGRINLEFWDSSNNIVWLLNKVDHNYFTSNVTASAEAGWSCTSEFLYTIKVTAIVIVTQAVCIIVIVLIFLRTNYILKFYVFQLLVHFNIPYTTGSFYFYNLIYYVISPSHPKNL